MRTACLAAAGAAAAPASAAAVRASPATPVRGTRGARMLAAMGLVVPNSPPSAPIKRGRPAADGGGGGAPAKKRRAVVGANGGGSADALPPALALLARVQTALLTARSLLRTRAVPCQLQHLAPVVEDMLGRQLRPALLQQVKAIWPGAFGWRHVLAPLKADPRKVAPQLLLIFDDAAGGGGGSGSGSDSDEEGGGGGSGSGGGGGGSGAGNARYLADDGRRAHFVSLLRRFAADNQARHRPGVERERDGGRLPTAATSQGRPTDTSPPLLPPLLAPFRRPAARGRRRGRRARGAAAAAGSPAAGQPVA